MRTITNMAIRIRLRRARNRRNRMYLPQDARGLTEAAIEGPRNRRVSDPSDRMGT